MRRPRAYILAGGRSQRFGSDKARAPLAGEPMLATISRRVAAHGLDVTAIADRKARYDDLGVQTIADATPHRGPLGGLLTALRDADRHDATHLLLLACDQPGVDASWLTPLLDLPDPPQIVAYRASTPAMAYPMPGLYAVTLMDEVQALLVGDNPPGPQRLIERCVARGTARLLPPPGPLLDVNAPDRLPEHP